MYMASPVYGYMGNLLAAFGGLQMLRACSTADDEAAASGGTYVSILAAIVAVTVMTVVDLALAPKSASAIATESTFEYFDECEKSMGKIFANDAKAVESVIDSKDVMVDKLTNMRFMVDEALKEPRFWRKPFPSSIYVYIAGEGQQMLMNLMLVSGAMSGVANALRKLAQLDPAPPNGEPVEKLKKCSALANLQVTQENEYTQTEDLLECVMKKEKATDIESMYAELADDDGEGAKAMAELKTQLTEQLKKEDPAGSDDLADDAHTRLHIIVQGLEMLGDQITSVQQEAYLSV